MRRTAILIFTLVFWWASPVSTWGQSKNKPREATVEGTEVVVVEDWMSQKYAEALALRKARENAIGNEFGWIINGKTHTRVDQTVEYNEYSLNQVKGFWVKTLKENWESGTDRIKIPGTLNKYREVRWVKCTVKGKAKEMIEPPVEFEAKPLRCTDAAHCATDEFKNDDDFYLRFVSPVDGYLAVYLELENSVQALLPYEGMEESFLQVEKDKEYILFSQPREPNYFMYTDLPIEIDVLTIIFSKTPFDKPILQDANDEAFESGTAELPKEADKTRFYKWITKLRSLKNDTQVKEILITIKNEANN